MTADRPGKPASVLILGSGPVVIGQAAEFDYAGTQACRALRAEGVRTILVNSNPATIMTDPQVADAIYLEPLTVEAVEAVIAKERPEGLLAGLGGQTALNLATALSEAGVFDRYPIRLLGTPLEAIRMAEDREAFRDLLDRIGQPYAPSWIVENAEDVDGRRSQEIGLPAIVRPAFTLGGTGGGIVETEAAYRERVRAGLRASPIDQVMVERCLVGWQEIEYEVMRDADDTCIAVCSMENVDPLGVHTGDSIVVAPVQTLTDAVHQRLRSAALAIIRALGVEGGCNVQFALSPDSTEYAVIEVNPRVSRSSALASKATGYPIARVAAQIAVGRRLAEIPNVVTGTTVAAFEPALDYVVVKLPRFPFDKFPGADRTLGSQMKATGEVMAIDRTFGSALNKALRGLEQAGRRAAGRGRRLDADLRLPRRRSTRATPTPTSRSAGSTRRGQACESTRHAQRTGRPDRAAAVPEPSDSRLWRLLGLLRRGRAGGGHRRGDRDLRRGSSPRWAATSRSRHETARDGRAAGGSGRRGGGRAARDGQAGRASAIASWPGWPARPRTSCGRPGWRSGIVPGYAMVDTCAAEFAAETPYFYATYAAAGSAPGGAAGRAAGGARHRLGAGPHRPGHRVRLLRRPGGRHAPPRRLAGGDDQLEPGDRLDRLRRLVAALLRAARPGERAQRHRRRVAADGDRTCCRRWSPFGGQTPLNLAAPLAAGGVPLLGSDLEAIDQAEERTRFSALLDRLGIPQPEGGMAHSVEEALTLAERIGYPVIVRPSFVIGGLAIDFCYSPEDLERQLAAATVVDPDRPVRIDRYLEGVEVDVDAVSRRRAGAHPGPARARRAGRRPLAATRSACSRRRPCREGDQDLIVATMERIVLGARRARPRQRPVHRPRRRRLPDRGQSARRRGPCRSCRR